MVIGVVKSPVSRQVDHLVILVEVELHDGLASLATLRRINATTLLEDSMQSREVQRLAVA